MVLTWIAVIVALFTGYVIKQFIAMLISPLYKVPGPPAWSPMGHISIIMNEPPGDSYVGWNEKYGGIIRYVFPIYYQKIAIVDPDYIKHVLVTHCIKYRKPQTAQGILKDAIGEGLVLLEGQKHAKVRKILNPAFKYSKIKGMVSIFHNFSQEFVQYWKSEIDNCGDAKATLEVQKDLSRITLDIICKCAFDYNCNALLDPSNETSAAFSRVIGGLDFNWTFLIPFYKFIPTSGNLKIKRARSICHDTVSKVITEKLQRGFEDEERCLLDILLSLKDEESNNNFTKEELKNHVLTFMSAGHETTASALSWTLYALANNNKVQEKARREIYNVLGQCDNITWDILDELKYLDNVIKESLRLYSPLPIVFREAIVDDKIGEYSIPKGTFIALIPPHRFPKYFQDPLTFNPDRWDTTAKDISPYAYLPFIRGPRTCIGSKFAVTEAKCILCLLLKNFSFAPVPDQKIERKLYLTLKPDPSLKLIVSRISSS